MIKIRNKFPEIEIIDTLICYLGGGGAGSSGSTSSSGPWSGQTPYLSGNGNITEANTGNGNWVEGQGGPGIFGAAQALYDSYTPQYYGATGTTLNGQSISGQSTVSPMNSQETGAISQMNNLGMNGNSSLNASNNALTNYANGNMLNASSNPGLQSVEQQAAASITPGLMSGFTQGTTDNPNSIMAASNGVSNAVGNIAYQNYNQQSQNQLQAASQAPYLYNAQMGGINSALTGGQDLQSQSQNELTNNVNMFNYQQQLPYQMLNNYTNTVNGQYGQTTSNVSPAGGFFTSLFS